MSVVTPAASVLLSKGVGSQEVYLVRRSDHLPFFGGFWAFPGGKVFLGDSDIIPSGESGAQSLNTLRAAAVRELFEETGVLLAKRADGSFPESGDVLDSVRRDLLAETRPFADVLNAFNLRIDPGDLVPIGEVTTPAFVPMRFATTFFVAHLPPAQHAQVWPGELSEGRWSTAEEMLDCWTKAACLLSPPTMMTLQSIHGRSANEAPQKLGPLLRLLAAGRIHPIFFAPAVQLIPLATMALPPSTHTNAYLVGRKPCYLIDPGPSEAGEQQRLFDLLDEHLRSNGTLTAIVLTHHHPDHIGAVQACVERYRLPVWAHAWTADKLRDTIPVSRPLNDGDRLDLGPCPDDGGPWYLQAIHTPGHAPGHLAFHEPHYRLLLAGDMISTVSSIVIAPPEGDIAVYLQSLRRLRELDLRLLLPAHGNASAKPRAAIDEAIAHRQRREEQLLEALARGPRTVPELVTELYRGLPEPLLRFAELQVLAGLYKLSNENRVRLSPTNGRESWELSPAFGGEHPPAAELKDA